MQIKLGSDTFELASGTFITKQPLIEYPQHLRTTGQQERGGQTLMSNWWLENFESGFGCNRIDLVSDRMKSSFWDSTADTIHRGQITNPRLCQAIPVASTSIAPYAVYEYGGTFWGLAGKFSLLGTLNWGQKDRDTIKGDKIARLQYTGTQWTVADATLGTSYDRFAKNIDYVGGLAALFRHEGTNNTPTLNDSEVVLLTPTLGDVVTTYNSAGKDSYPYFWKWANTTQAAVVIGMGDNLFCYGGDKLDSFGEFGVGGSLGPIKNMRMFQGQDGYEGLFIFYKNKLTCWENFYLNVDTPEVESSEIPYLDLFGLEDPNNMCDVAVFNGSMVFPVQDSLLAYSSDGSVMDVGMNLFSGMPSDKQGKVEALCSSVRHLYACVNQSGVRQIYQFDGTGWHWFGKTPTMGNLATSFCRLNMVTNPSGIPQLMINVEGDATSYVWDYPDTNPLFLPGSGTISWEASSHVVTPEFDGGLPNQTGVAYKVSVEGVFDSARKATLYYSTIGGATGWVALGQATQSGRTSFDFGTLGIPHDIIQFKFGLEGNATSTPVIRTVVLDYLKFPEVRDVYTFTVDLVKTYGGNLASVQSGLDVLASIRDSYPMVPFQYGNNATVNVKVLEMPANEEAVTTTDGVYATTGMAALVTMRAVRLI